MTPTEVQDLMLAFNKAITERAMDAEMNLHLATRRASPSRPGKPTSATARAARRSSPIAARVDVPRDRGGSFEPILIPKRERRFTGFDERIIAMYARGMSVREIQAFLAESYGTEVSPDFISSVTDEVMAEALSWQSLPLETMYPVVFFDALRVKVHDDGVVNRGLTSLTARYRTSGGLPSASRKRCSCSESVSISALAMCSSTLADGAPPRPCSSHVYHVGLIFARWATSSRRGPGVRRRPEKP
ncbi:hypothetical protein G3N96_03005 [Burkholderia sp. Se-20373]|nr:hypothetical protein [Burkholderia sp. Se-20373]